MNSAIELSDLEADLLKEVFNVGVGYAAASLSTLLKQPILLSVPDLSFLNEKELVDHLGVAKKLCLVRQRAKGDFSFTSTLMFPESSALELVRMFAPSGIDDSLLIQMQEEGMAEIGNILLNACIGRMGDMAKVNFDLGLPDYQIIEVSENVLALLGEHADHDNILLISIQMILRESQFSGEVMFLFDQESLNGFRKHLNLILSQIGA